MNPDSSPYAHRICDQIRVVAFGEEAAIGLGAVDRNCVGKNSRMDLRIETQIAQDENARHFAKTLRFPERAPRWI